MIWIGLIIFIIIGIFYSRNSIFVERRFYRRYSRWNIDQIDYLNEADIEQQKKLDGDRMRSTKNVSKK